MLTHTNAQVTLYEKCTVQCSKYINKHSRTHTLFFIRAHMHMQVRTYAHTYVSPSHKSTLAQKRTSTHHTCTHTHARTHIHKHTHTYTYTYTYTYNIRLCKYKENVQN